MTIRIAITRRAVLDGDLDSVFATVTSEDILPKVLTGYGPLPAVIDTSDLTGPWDVPGSIRTVHLADGSSVREQLLRREEPTHFAYRVFDFRHPILKRLAREGLGEWWFSADDKGVAVKWTYTFAAKNPVAAMPLWLMGNLFWRGYMDVCLHHLQAIQTLQAIRISR